MRAQTLFGCVITMVACGNPRDASAPERDASVSEPPKPGEVASQDAAVSRDAGPPTFSVNVTSSKLELCAGECADLTVSARHGGEVSYAWSDGLSAGAAQHVCPTTTHTYRVDATASTTSGEFMTQQSANDGITLSVRDCSVPKADDGVLCELRHRFDYPRSGDVFRASKPWVNLDTYSGSGAIQSTPEGGAWVVGSFAEELDLGAGRVEAKAPMSTFLHQLDKDCKPVRTLVLSATTPSDTILPAALAVDAQGNAYVASIAGPLFEYNLFAPSPVRWTSELLIEKISPAGDSLYRHRIATGPGGLIADMEVNAAGEVFLSGMVPETTDLGSGLPIGLAFSTFRTFALKLGTDGRFRAQRINTGAYYLAIGGDKVFSVANGSTSFDVLSAVLFGFSSAEPPSFGIVGASQSDLLQQWLTPFDLADGSNPSIGEGFASGALALIFDREVQLSETRARRSHLFKRYGSDGKLVRETTLIEREVAVHSLSADAGIEDFLAYVEDSLYFTHLRESEPGTMVMAGSFYSSQQLAGTQLTAGPTIGTGLVIKLDQDDEIRWVRQQDWGPETSLRGVASRASGEVFVAGQARVAGAPMDSPDVEWDLVIRKLRAD